ncbi:hypothetical protein RHSIM_Rhsim05G0145700 [Rhododendron simsii]|uniref:Major facilitator superfamily (MFS) profile domain-containing protein n=1 Tax=Rhododendron simsii TaxID=118357 RepID=A0A834GZJ6_RHOSS|nr:hypothetical protein RHSIM_Rhsim05G0145700 [Rhododendron simsii]
MEDGQINRRLLLEEKIEDPNRGSSSSEAAEGGISSSSVTAVVVLSTSVAVVGSFSYGFAAGFSSQAESGIRSDLGLSIAAYSLFGSMLTVGGMVGATVSGKVADLIGRRFVNNVAVRSMVHLRVACNTFCTAVTVQTGLKAVGTATKRIKLGVAGVVVQTVGAWMLDVGRAVLGLGIGIQAFVAPAYIGEISPKNTRGGFTAANQLLNCCGLSVVYFVGNLVTWRTLAIIGIIPCMVQVVGVFFIPESPRWLPTLRIALDAMAAARVRWGRGEEAASPAPIRTQRLKNKFLGGGVGGGFEVDEGGGGADGCGGGDEDDDEEHVDGDRGDDGGVVRDQRWERRRALLEDLTTDCTDAAEGVKIGKEKDLDATLHRLRGKDADVSQEAAEIRDYIEIVQQLPKARFLDMFQRKYAHSLTVGFAIYLEIGFGLLVLAIFGGTVGISYYASSIYEAAGCSVSIGTTTMAIVQIPFSVLGLLLMDIIGRRPLWMISAAGTCLANFLIGLGFLLQNLNQSKDLTAILVFSGIQLYVATFSAGMASTPWVVVSEMLPIDIKGPAGSLITFCNWASAWVVSYGYIFILDWSPAGPLSLSLSLSLSPQYACL